ncbi:alginate O-acetyltransferase AlgF [Gallionella capsiferriformans]|nr:alginate O-acetyltransferase AlgF [Gallionella capsiferriformans]
MLFIDYIKRNCSPLLAIVMCCCLFGKVNANEALLYDLEPPADSTYVRIIHTSAHRAVDVHIDGRMRMANLHSGTPSTYIILPPGKHELTIRAAGKSQILATSPLNIEGGQSMTIAYEALRTNVKPLVFNDKLNENHLKAMLSVYNLDSKNGTFDILTADGKTAVFSGIAAGKNMMLSVNPVSVNLILTKTGNKVARAKIPVSMMAGATYSILLLPGEGGDPLIYIGQNKTERYTTQ